VAIMNAGGSGLVEFSPDPNVCEGDPSFTPDGSRIVFHRFDLAANDEAFWTMTATATIGNALARAAPIRMFLPISWAAMASRVERRSSRQT
jgi:hypothetical protein